MEREEVNKLADDSYEGCDGCTEFQEKMWKEGFVRGFFECEAKTYSREEVINLCRDAWSDGLSTRDSCDGLDSVSIMAFKEWIEENL